MFAFCRYGDRVVEVVSASTWAPLQKVRHISCIQDITQIEWIKNDILATLTLDNLILLFPRAPVDCQKHSVFDMDRPDFLEAYVEGNILCLRFNPSGDHVVLSTDVSELVVFKQMETQNLRGHRGWIQIKHYSLAQCIYSLEYDPLNTFFAAAGYERSLYILHFQQEDPSVNEYFQEATDPDQLLEEEIYDIAVSPSGSEICVSLTGSFFFFDVQAFNVTRVVKSQSEPCHSLRYIHEDLVIAGGFTRTPSVLLDKCLYKLHKSVTFKSQPVLVIRVFPCRKHLLVAGGGGLVEEWRLD